MQWYNGKKTVITGGSSGIGKAVAILLARWGAHVCICGRDTGRLEAALAEIRSHAASGEQKIIAIGADVSDRAQVNRMAVDAVKQLGGIDILINSAGSVSAWSVFFNKTIKAARSS